MVDTTTHGSDAMAHGGSTDVGGGLDRRALLRSLGIAGGMAAWTAPSILLATPAGAVSTYSVQYSALVAASWTWETTTDPTLDLGSPSHSEWSSCKPSPWSLGVDPGSLPVPMPSVSYTGSVDSGQVVFTAHSTCRIAEAYATVVRPGTSGGDTYTCQVATIPNPTWTGNTATFPALPVATGDFRLGFRLRLACGS